MLRTGSVWLFGILLAMAACLAVPAFDAAAGAAPTVKAPATDAPAEGAKKPPVTADVPRKDAGLTGVDLDGKLHRITETEGVRAIVLVFLSTDCPISNGCIPALNQLAAQRKARGFEVYGVHSNPGVSRARAVKHRGEFGLKFPVLFDASGELRSRLKPTHTPHAFVLTRAGAVAYQGAVDNRYAGVGRKKADATENHVLAALNAVLAGKPAPLVSTPPVGCLMESAADPTRPGSVTFNRDIAPILHTHCAACHREGQAAPFPLLTYDDAAGHARQIVAVTASRQMPPWKPVAGHGRFKDERRLSARELGLISTWAESGKAEGNADDLPATPVFSDGWTLGKPDVVLKMPKAFDVPASGGDLHRHFVLHTGVADARLISAVEFRPGNARVVHHACFYLDNTGAARRLDEADPGPGYGGPGGALFVPQGTLRSWLPGFTPRRLPDGTGRRMLKASDLILELHYQPSGKPETDQSTVALYYAPRKARQLVGEYQVLNYNLDIPAGATRHRHHASYTVAADVILLDCAPHMHLLGREISATATLPDGRVEPLIRITDWHYQWQEQYEYLEPVRLPKGTRIDVEAWYDNSTANPLNPFSPPQRVRWGEQTKEEMGMCHFQFTCNTMAEFQTAMRHYDEWRFELSQRGNGAARTIAP